MVRGICEDVTYLFSLVTNNFPNIFVLIIALFVLKIVLSLELWVTCQPSKQSSENNGTLHFFRNYSMFRGGWCGEES